MKLILLQQVAHLLSCNKGAVEFGIQVDLQLQGSSEDMMDHMRSL